jgi:hypothetical protein
MKIESRTGAMGTRVAATPDRWVTLSVVDETLSATERRFGRVVEGQVLDRFALEAAIDLLSSPSRIIDAMPDLAVRRMHERIAPGVGTDR